MCVGRRGRRCNVLSAPGKCAPHQLSHLGCNLGAKNRKRKKRKWTQGRSWKRRSGYATGVDGLFIHLCIYPSDKMFPSGAQIRLLNTHTSTHKLPLVSSPHVAPSCRLLLVCSLIPNMASHCVLTQARSACISSPLSVRTHQVRSSFTVCRSKEEDEGAG